MRLFTLIAALVVTIIVVVPAYAHKVNVFAYAEDGKVHAECYFVDGTPCAKSKVTLEDMSGKILAEGVTDDQGIYVFDIPGPKGLKVVLHASMGHMNDYTLSEGEIKAAYRGAGAGEAKTVTVKKASPLKAAAPKASSGEPPACPMPEKVVLDTEEIRSVVDEVVEARLAPVNRMLADMREESDKPKLTDVVGGIGYILGIMGIIMYFKSRKA